MQIEREVWGLYAAAKASIETGAPLGFLIEETMGLRPMFAPSLAADAITVRHRKHRGCMWRILVRWGIDPPHARYLAAGQLAAWYLRRYGSLPATPPTLSRMAAAILAPAPLFRAVADDVEHDVHDLGDAFCIPEPLVLLRLGEVLGIRVALHSPDHKVVTIRGRRGVRRCVKTIHFSDDARLGRMYG